MAGKRYGNAKANVFPLTVAFPKSALATSIVTLTTHLIYKNSVFSFKRNRKTLTMHCHIHYTFELLMPPKSYMLYFIGHIKNFKNNFTHTWFSSYIIVLEPNTQMKGSSIVVKLHVLEFALQIWSLSLQGEGLGCWLHLLPTGVIVAPYSYQKFPGTLLRKASIALISLNTILLHQPSTLAMRYSTPYASTITVKFLFLAHWNASLAETI